MDKKMVLVLLVILSVLSLPVLAALEWTETLLYFNVASLDEVKVYILGESGVIAGSGTPTSQNIEFNTSTASYLWKNASVLGGNENSQNDDDGILWIENSGSTTPTLNLSVNVSDWSTEMTCGGGGDGIDLHYFANQTGGAPQANYTTGTPESEDQLNSTNVTLDPSFTPGEQSWEVWLWANFSICSSGTYGAKLYVWADFP